MNQDILARTLVVLMLGKKQLWEPVSKAVAQKAAGIGIVSFLRGPARRGQKAEADMSRFIEEVAKSRAAGNRLVLVCGFPLSEKEAEFAADICPHLLAFTFEEEDGPIEAIVRRKTKVHEVDAARSAAKQVTFVQNRLNDYLREADIVPTAIAIQDQSKVLVGA